MREKILQQAAKLDAKLESPRVKKFVDFIASRRFLYFGLALWVFGAVAPTIIDWIQR